MIRGWSATFKTSRRLTETASDSERVIRSIPAVDQLLSVSYHQAGRVTIRPALYFKSMDRQQLAEQIIATYARHGWTLRRVLLRPETRSEVSRTIDDWAKGVPLIETGIDALWFARPSTRGCEAWELRLLSEQPYALFQAFEADATEETREQTRRELEARMRERGKN